MERETGIEPATNSLEGCDSTTELLPPFLPATDCQYACPPSLYSFGETSFTRLHGLPSRSSLACQASEGWWGGEGSNLRSPKAAGLQPAAIDRSATSPKTLRVFAVYRNASSVPRLSVVSWSPCFCGRPCSGVDRPMELAEGFEPPTG